jgi:hypothetical protein
VEQRRPVTCAATNIEFSSIGIATVVAVLGYPFYFVYILGAAKILGVFHVLNAGHLVVVIVISWLSRPQSRRLGGYSVVHGESDQAVAMVVGAGDAGGAHVDRGGAARSPLSVSTPPRGGEIAEVFAATPAASPALAESPLGAPAPPPPPATRWHRL